MAEQHFSKKLEYLLKKRHEYKILSNALAIPHQSEMTSGPLSSSQQGIWLFEQTHPDTHIYTVPLLMHLCGYLDVKKLKRSLYALMKRHESMRTIFTVVDGIPQQMIVPEADLPFEVYNVENTNDEYIQELITSHIRKPLKLEASPLLQVILFRCNENEHYLLFRIHHLIFDGWSTDIFFRELWELYTAQISNRTAQLSSLPIRYLDYCLWQQRRLQESSIEKHMNYWEQELTNIPDLLDLPWLHARPAIQSLESANQDFTCSREMIERLQAFSQTKQTTLTTVLLAAYVVLLFRYSRQQDIVIGLPIAGRTRQETEGIIGLFVNTLAIRTRLTGEQTFHEVLERVKTATLGAYTHQEPPFERVIEDLQPERSLNHHPIFQVVFAPQVAYKKTLNLNDLTIHLQELSNGLCQYHLKMITQETPEGLYGSIEYHTHLLDARIVKGMIEHYQQLLNAIVTHPDQPIARLSMVSPHEYQRLVYTWNATQTAYQRQQCIHERFEEQVRRSPDAIAIHTQKEILTYKELNQRANQLAHYLHKQGAGQGTHIGIYLDRSPIMIISILAILKVGGVYIPLDLTYPSERISFMLSDANTQLLLTTRQLSSRLPESNIRMIELDSCIPIIQQENSDNLLQQGSTSNAIAYIMYTSGSTGEPKGICIPHRAVIRLICSTNYIHIQSTDIIAQASNASFDAATFEIWGALLHGARLVLVEKEALISPRILEERLQQSGINVLFLTTALFNQIAREAPHIFFSLRYLLFGGEASNAKSASNILEHGAPQYLLHVYGPTESTTFASWYHVQHITEDQRTIPIGSPIANTQLYILDEYLQPVPAGIPGEIYIGGDGLAQCYLKQAALTAEHFIPHPFSAEPGMRLYKTGDLGRYLPEGAIEFIGRVDKQIKIRGFRIEPGEIEAVLCQHPDVQDAAVQVSEEDAGEKSLIAFILAPQKGLEDAHLFRDYLRQRLPEYMVPTKFFMLATAPLTPNGKLDRKALPASHTIPAYYPTGHTFVAPHTFIQNSLAAIWCDVLKQQHIGIYDNFFEIGGHSLKATQILSRIYDTHQVHIPLRDFFLQPTIAGLALLIEQKQTQKETHTQESISPVQRSGKNIADLFREFEHSEEILLRSQLEE